MSGPVILNRQRQHPVAISRLRHFVLLLSERLHLGNQSFTVVLVSDRAMRRLNRDFRNKDRVTDVLSFPAEPHNRRHLDNPGLGDMIISVETAHRQAFDRNHSLDRELRVLLIHGLLHLLGYDHEVDRGEMRRKELKLQRELL